MLVLVTRPREQSADTVEALEALGHEALVDPLLAIRPLDPGPIDFDPADAVIVTSANAVQALRAVPPSLPIYAVGESTAAAVRSKVGNAVRVGPGDGAGLAETIIEARQATGGPHSVLHLRGAAVAADLETRLTAAGLRYRSVVVYEAVTADALAPSTVNAMRGRQLGAVLLFSPRTARTFADLVIAADLGGALDGVDALCLSDNVAAAVRDLRWRSVRVAPTRDQTALIRCLAPALAAMVPPPRDGGA